MMFDSSQGFGTQAFVSSLQPSQSTDASPTPAKTRESQSMYPVTVKQIAESTDDNNYLIDGHNVKLVGLGFDKVVRASDASFVIDDGTGRIGCKKWGTDSLHAKEVDRLTERAYVRVHGTLTTFQGKRQIKVYAIRSVTDYNEITNHYLECIYANCCHLQTSGNKQSVSASSSYSPSVASPNGNQAATPSGNQTATPNGNQAVSSFQLSQDGPRDIEKMVEDYIRHAAADVGIHQDVIAKDLKIPREKIKEILASLIDSGVIYTTIDDDLFKTANGLL